MVMKAFGSEGCWPNGRIILSLHWSCSRQSCFWEGHGRLQRIDALVASFSHTLQIWLEVIYFCVCLLFCPLLSDCFHNYRHLKKWMNYSGRHQQEIGCYTRYCCISIMKLKLKMANRWKTVGDTIQGLCRTLRLLSNANIKTALMKSDDSIKFLNMYNIYCTRFGKKLANLKAAYHRHKHKAEANVQIVADNWSKKMEKLQHTSVC